MSDKLPTREEAKNHANMFRYYVSGSGKVACDVLTAYADGLLQPTQTYSEEEIVDILNKNFNISKPNDSLPGHKLFYDEVLLCFKDYAHALANKLVKPVVDREKIKQGLKMKGLHRVYVVNGQIKYKQLDIHEDDLNEIADAIITEVNGGD